MTTRYRSKVIEKSPSAPQAAREQRVGSVSAILFRFWFAPPVRSATAARRNHTRGRSHLSTGQVGTDWEHQSGRFRFSSHVFFLGFEELFLDEPHNDNKDDDNSKKQVNRPTQFLAEFFIATCRKPRNAHVGARPDQARGCRPGDKSAIPHCAHSHGEWNERVKHRQKSRHKNRRTATSINVATRSFPVLNAELVAEPRVLDSGTEPPTKREPEAFAKKSTNHDDNDGRQIVGDAGDRRRCRENNGIARDHKADKGRGFQHYGNSDDEQARYHADRGDRLQHPIEHMVHRSRVACAGYSSLCNRRVIASGAVMPPSITPRSPASPTVRRAV